MSIRTDQFPLASAIDTDDTVLGLVDGEDERIPISMLAEAFQPTAADVPATPSASFLTGDDVQEQLDDAEVALVAIAADVNTLETTVADAILSTDTTIGFFGVVAVARPTVTGVTTADQVASIIAALESLGLVIDGT